MSVSTNAGSKGVATAVSVGTTTLTASGPGDVQGSLDLTVSAATLVSLEVDPPAPSIAKGTLQAFTATGTFSDGTTQDLTSSATWSTSDAMVASVSNDAGTQGQATGLSPGAASISASVGGVSGSAPLNVTSAALSGLAVTPSSASLPKGLTQQLVATGTFSDGTTQDVTSLAAWGSSDGTIAAVSNDSGSHGLVRALAAGSATLTASLGGQVAQADLTVTAATLSAITLSGDTSYPAGIGGQLTATGTYSDGTTADITASVTWSSADTSIASISNTDPDQGQLSAIAPGETLISAGQGALTASLKVTVTDAALTGLTLTPADPTLAKGTTVQLVVSGSYSDGTSRDLTSSFTFTSADPSVASVSNASGSQGLLTGIAAGGPISVSVTNGSAGTSTSVTVSDATLVSIAVSPESATVVGTNLQQVTAIGTYSDGSTQEVTALVTWTSDNTSAATVSNAAGTNGQAQGVAPGNAHITAALDGVTSNAASLTVVPRALTSIAVGPSPAYLSSGSQQLTATGTYNDGTTEDLTPAVTWFSDNTAAYTVSNASGSQGMVTWVSSVETTLYAVLDDHVGQTVVQPCPSGFYVAGNRCAYDYYVGASGLVGQTEPSCGNGIYYGYGWFYGMQWTDVAPAGLTPTQITVSFSIGVSCGTPTQTYDLNGAAAGSITLQDECTCSPPEQQKTLDLSAVAASYVPEGVNTLSIQSDGSPYGFMPDSAIGGQYGKVTVVY